MRSDRLKDYRQKREMTQEALAFELGTDKKQVNRWESGESSPSAGRLADLSRILNVSADYLLGLSDNPLPNPIISNLSDDEYEVINAMRQGQSIQAIRIIANR